MTVNLPRNHAPIGQRLKDRLQIPSKTLVQKPIGFIKDQEPDLR
jgi:hypothetical protein